jgi:hypothetical protein
MANAVGYLVEGLGACLSGQPSTGWSKTTKKKNKSIKNKQTTSKRTRHRHRRRRISRGGTRGAGKCRPFFC